MKKKNVINAVVVDNSLEDVREFVEGLEAFDKRKWDVLVHTSNDRSGKLLNAIRYFKYFFVGGKLFFTRSRYNTVITYQQFYGLIFAMLCRIFRVKKRFVLIIMSVVYKDKQGKLLHRLYKKFYEYAIESKYIDAIVCATTNDVEKYSSIFNIPKEKLPYIRWGVRDHSSAHQCSGNVEKYIFSAGKSNRDWEFVFAALGQSKYNAVIVGAESNYKDRFDNMTVLSKIPDTEYYDVLANSYCVFLSLKDTTVAAGQITLIQAMQFGKPLIVTEAEGLTNDYVINGENGLIVEKDKSAVLSAIERLYTDEGLYRKISINARKTYETDLSSYRMGIEIGRMLARLNVELQQTAE